MMEIFSYIAIAALVIFFIVRITVDVNCWLNRRIDIRIAEKVDVTVQNYVKLSFIDLEKRLKLNSGQPENNDLRQTVAKDIANNQEILQNEATPNQPADFWKDTDRMRDLRDQLNGGNHIDYMKIDELAGLGPLDAMHFLDQKILEREESSKYAQA